MTGRVTRSQTGNTPRKPANPGYVETPGTLGRTRRSTSRRVDTPETDDDNKSLSTSNGTLSIPEEITKMAGNAKSNGNATGASATTNGTPTKRGSGRPRKSLPTQQDKVEEEPVVADFIDPKIDANPVYEFGGSLGCLGMMFGFPLLMWYMWLGATMYDGHFPYRSPGQSWSSFGQQMFSQVYEGAFPHARAWLIYWTFFVMQGVFYLIMPGVYTHGKPLEHLGGKKLDYYCSGIWSFYSTIVLSLVLHYTGFFPLYTLIDEFGPLMSVAIFTGFIVSFIAYFSALYRGAKHRMTGHFVYDFFMGAELNPRLFGLLDFKMFFEVRLPWFILFFVSLATAARQYDQYGYVSAEVAFLVMAHFLYANACCKGEELIPQTWDIYYEKWGFMLIFWNLAGVPLSYCHCTIYLANHHPSTYRWPLYVMVPLFVTYLLAYWVWDTCGSQKNIFRAREKGTAQDRKTFPYLPFREIKNPRFIVTESGDSLLTDGWYRYARKIHYTCDIYFALCWGFVTGFSSPFPWFYPIFFVLMIIHRATRDIHRCREKYGKSWVEYEQTVPYLFIPWYFLADYEVRYGPWVRAVSVFNIAIIVLVLQRKRQRDAAKRSEDDSEPPAANKPSKARNRPRSKNVNSKGKRRRW